MKKIKVLSIRVTTENPFDTLSLQLESKMNELMTVDMDIISCNVYNGMIPKSNDFTMSCDLYYKEATIVYREEIGIQDILDSVQIKVAEESSSVISRYTKALQGWDSSQTGSELIMKDTVANIKSNAFHLLKEILQSKGMYVNYYLPLETSSIGDCNNMVEIRFGFLNL